MNFRILSDGSLEKRYGYRLLCDLGGNLRAIWTGRIDGELSCFAIVDSSVYSVCLSDGSYSLIGELSSSQGNADLFYYRSCLYAVDGVSIYKIDSNGVSIPEGYVPLVGKDWTDMQIGAPYEEKNLLTKRARISYVIGDEPSSFLKTDEPISSIEAVYVNGSKRSASSYSITALPRTINISDLAAGDRVMVYFTYASVDYSADSLLSCTRAGVFGGISDSRPFLWGGNDGATVFNASSVSSASVAEARIGYPSSDALYFPVNCEFIVGDGSSSISAVSRHYNRLLLFTQNDVWMAQGMESDGFPVMKINTVAGVVSPDAAAMLENEPCTVGEHSIYRWTSKTNELNECNCYSISKPIDSLLPSEFFKTAKVFSDIRRSELIFCSPALNDRIFIYSVRSSSWFVFDGISADRFIRCEHDVGFVKDGRIYVFDSSLYRDEGESEILALYQSSALDTKKTSRLKELQTAYSGGELNVSFLLDGEASPSVYARFSDSHTYVRKRVRLVSRRCSRFSFRISALGDSRQRIRGLEISYR